MTQASSHSLTATLDQLVEACEKGPITLNEVLHLTADRGMAILMVVCTAAFLIPISIPGLSTPFGAVLAFCGVFTAFARPIQLPRRLGSKALPKESMLKALGILRRMARRLERFLRPRLPALTSNRSLLRLHGFYVLLMALILAIPFPTVPFIGSNAVAAWPIFLLGLGLIERDGVFVAIAYGWLIPFVLYWIFFYKALGELWKGVWPQLSGLLGG
jgi:hypothetical protein